jgi:hypothetical protein
MSDTAPDGRALRLSDRCRQGLPAVALGPVRRAAAAERQIGAGAEGAIVTTSPALKPRNLTLSDVLHNGIQMLCTWRELKARPPKNAEAPTGDSPLRPLPVRIRREGRKRTSVASIGDLDRVYRLAGGVDGVPGRRGGVEAAQVLGLSP